jgi:hypothetical protein
LTKEDPGGEAPSAATPAQAVQELRPAWEAEVTRAQELADALARERARVKKLAPLHKSAAARNQTQVKLFAAYPSQVTNDHYVELGGELRRERELALELERAEAHVQELAIALAESQNRAQALERTLALAMAQARTLAREQAQARSPRVEGHRHHSIRPATAPGSFGSVGRHRSKLVPGDAGRRAAGLDAPEGGSDSVEGRVLQRAAGSEIGGYAPPRRCLTDRSMDTLAAAGAVDQCMETFISSTVAATAEAAVDRRGDGGCDISGWCRRDRSVPNRSADAVAPGRVAATGALAVTGSYKGRRLRRRRHKRRR